MTASARGAAVLDAARTGTRALFAKAGSNRSPQNARAWIRTRPRK